MSLHKHFKIPAQARKALEVDDKLPSMGTFSEEDHRDDPRLAKLFESVGGFLKDIDLFVLTAQQDPNSVEHREFYRDKDKSEEDLVRLLTIVNYTLRRCCHHVLKPELYFDCAGAIALYWRAAACFSPVALEYSDIEVVDTEFKSSRYFVKKSRNDVEPPNKSRSYYDACRRLLHAFPWASAADKKMFAAFCDGFCFTEIAVLVGEELNYVKARMDYYISVAKEYEEEDA